MEDFMRIAKALAEQNRVRALLALDGRELCVCQLIELLQLAPATVSKHISILRQARLVEGRKRGRWVYYRIVSSRASPTVRDAVGWLRRCLASNPRIREDAGRLARILSTERELLCRRQTKHQSCGEPSAGRAVGKEDSSAHS